MRRVKIIEACTLRSLDPRIREEVDEINVRLPSTVQATLMKAGLIENPYLLATLRISNGSLGHRGSIYSGLMLQVRVLGFSSMELTISAMSLLMAN